MTNKDIIEAFQKEEKAIFDALSDWFASQDVPPEIAWLVCADMIGTICLAIVENEKEKEHIINTAIEVIRETAEGK